MVLILEDRPKIEPLDFGGWVKKQIERAGVTAAQLSTETGILYPNVLRLLNSGRNGKPIRPDHETIERVAETLVKLEAIEDARDAFVAAGYVPEGYRVVRERTDQSLEEMEEDEMLTDPRFEVVREAFNGADEEDRDYLADTAKRLQKAKMAQDAARRGAIGRGERAREDGD